MGRVFLLHKLHSLISNFTRAIDLNGLAVSICKFFILILLLNYLYVPSSFAQEEIDDTEELLDIVLLLDASGSMSITDPKRIREESYRMFVDFIKPTDRIAVVEFSDHTKVLRDLSPYLEEQGEELLKEINSVKDEGEYTDLLDPLKLAYKMLKSSPRPGAKPIIVMLSDGKMDPDPKKGSAAVLTSSLTSELLPQMKKDGVKVYTLSFSSFADRALLSYIATATNGVPWFTANADQIHESFAELFLVLKKPQIVSMTSKGFRIDAEIDEATFYINREGGKDVTLLAPDGTKLTETVEDSKIKWFKGQQFDVVTVKNPKPGQWQVLGLPKNEGFATVLTQLKLATNWPTSVYSGDEQLLEVRMYESRKPVILPEMTDMVKYAFRITPTDRVSEPVVKAFLVDDGTEGDREARDGVFSSKVNLTIPGEYKLQVVASGPTFERHQQLAFKVKPRMLSLVIVKDNESMIHMATNSIRVEGAPVKEYFQLRVSTELQGNKKLQISLMAVDKSNRKYSLPLAKFDNVYEVGTTSLPHQGEYKVQGFFTAEGRAKGRAMRGESEVLNYVSMTNKNAKSTVQVVDSQAEQVIQIVGEVPSGPPKEPWLIYLGVMSLINIGVGMSMFMKAKKNSGSGGNTIDFAKIITPNTAYEELIKHLEAIVAQTEVNLESNIFTDKKLKIVVRDSSSASAAVSEDVAPATDESEAGQESAEDTSGEDASSEEAEPSEEDLDEVL